jgi:hypothetical protein
VSWAMTGGVKPWEMLSIVASPGLDRDEVTAKAILPFAQGLSTPRT